MNKIAKLLCVVVIALVFITGCSESSSNKSKNDSINIEKLIGKYVSNDYGTGTIIIKENGVCEYSTVSDIPNSVPNVSMYCNYTIINNKLSLTAKLSVYSDEFTNVYTIDNNYKSLTNKYDVVYSRVSN